MAKHFHVLPAEATAQQDQCRAVLNDLFDGENGADLMQAVHAFICDAIKHPELPDDDIASDEELKAALIENMVFKLAAYGIAAYCLDSQKMQETDDGQ